VEETVDIKALKLDLVKKIIQTEKPSLLLEIEKIFSSEKPKDWWDELPKEVKESIMEGLDDIKNGNVYSHEQVINEARQKYGF
jgi:predicted transcriptional regulator